MLNEAQTLVDAVYPYDRVPYTSLPFPQSHPSRLYSLAKLFGLTPPSIDRARVLELGCASGGNLVGVAIAYPHSVCVGVDLSKKQIEQGKSLIGQLGLTNCELRNASITDIDETWGKFDFIVAHGVWSWVPEDVRSHIFTICRDNLSGNGVAYVSYNTYPGWHIRGAVGEMMKWHTAGIEDSALKAQQARALLNFLVESTPTQGNLWGQILRVESQLLARQPDSYLLHDHLEEVNHPAYFYQFVQQASNFGLQYLGEAEIASMTPSGFSPAVINSLRQVAPDIYRMEQYLDFLRNRTFRQTLLVGKGANVDRRLDYRKLAGLCIGSPLKRAQVKESEHTAARFLAANGQFADIAHPLTQAALEILAGIWPQTMKFESLVSNARQSLEPSPIMLPDPAGEDAARKTVGDDLVQLYLSGFLELRPDTLPLATSTQGKPVAFSLARAQAGGIPPGQGGPVTNLRHELVTLDPLAVRLVALLDGSRTRAGIIDALEQHFADGSLKIERDGLPILDSVVRRGRLVTVVDDALRQLRSSALLIAQ